MPVDYGEQRGPCRELAEPENKQTHPWQHLLQKEAALHSIPQKDGTQWNVEIGGTGNAHEDEVDINEMFFGREVEAG